MPVKAFAFTGIHGDDSLLRNFRMQVADTIELDVIEYPGVLSDTTLLNDFDSIVNYLTIAVSKRKPVGPIVLFGYSFGGAIAFEVSRRLVSEGRVVDFTVVLDAPLPKMEFDLFRKWKHDLVPPRAMHKRIITRVIELSGASFLLRKASVTVFSLFGHRLKIKFTKNICKALREKARRDRWYPSPSNVEGLLIFSEQFYSTTAIEWIRLCPLMHHHVINANHLSIISRENSNKIASIINSMWREEANTMLTA